MFEWDEEKNIANIMKHKIPFSQAVKVFLDPFKIDIFDDKHSSPKEDRYLVIGKVDHVLVVAYCERGSKTRIISARKATPIEKKVYYGTN